MSDEEAFDDIPGTILFDARRSRQGYHLNMFCMSLMKEENRKAFKANEAEYLKKFPLKTAQTQAILDRDYNRMLELGGNIYFTAKLGATDGHSLHLTSGQAVGAPVKQMSHSQSVSRFLHPADDLIGRSSPEL